jgi:hypothetical protein
MITPTTPTAPAHPLEPMLDANPAVVRGFSRAVTNAMEDGALSLATRDRLIERGVRLGLKRFDANLIIAVLEQRRHEAAPMRITREVSTDKAAPLPRWLRWATVATIQLAIATGVWWVVR